MHSVSKARYSSLDARSPYDILSRCRKSPLRATYQQVRDEPYWQVRITDSFGLLSLIFMGSPECRIGRTGLQENWKRIRRSSVLLVSDVLRCWSRARRSSFFPGLAGAWRVERSGSPWEWVQFIGRAWG